MDMLLHYGTNLPGSNSTAKEPSEINKSSSKSLSEESNASNPRESKSNSSFDPGSYIRSVAGSSFTPAVTTVKSAGASAWGGGDTGGAAAFLGGKKSLRTTGNIVPVSTNVNRQAFAAGSGSKNDISGKSAASKQRLLEARMGVGGVGASVTNSSNVGTSGRGATYTENLRSQNSSTRSSGGSYHFNQSFSNAAADNQSPNVKLFMSSLEAPASFFPGNQQFFFRFIVFTDSFRFCECLTICLLAQIDRINAVAMETMSAEIFYINICKLGIIGRFLGLLNFWPRWVLTIPADNLESGPFRNLIEKNIANRKLSLVSANSLPLTSIMIESLQEKRFCLTLPWVTEYLKLMVWDFSLKISASIKQSNNLSNFVKNQQYQSPKVISTRFLGSNFDVKPTYSGVASSPIIPELSSIQFLLSLLFSARSILQKDIMSTNK